MDRSANQLMNNTSAITTLKLRVIADSQQQAGTMALPAFMTFIQARLTERLNRGEGGDDAQRAWAAIQRILGNMKSDNCPQLAGTY